jgi:hypothetical protein
MFHDFELAHAESPLPLCAAASAGICSSSPPASWHSFAQARRRSWGATPERPLFNAARFEAATIANIDSRFAPSSTSDAFYKKQLGSNPIRMTQIPDGFETNRQDQHGQGVDGDYIAGRIENPAGLDTHRTGSSSL